MLLRLSSNAQRAVVLAVSVALALFLSYFSIRNAIAAHAAGLQTVEGFQRAARLEPANYRNWYLLGRYWQFNLEDPDSSRAIRSYLSALSFNPLSYETWLDLAIAYESEDNLTAARDAFLHAKKIYPLSAEVSWRYGNFLLRQGEIDPAFREMKQAVAADPKRSAEAFSRALRSGSTVDTALDRVLPPIAEAYLDVVWDQTTDKHTDNALKVWNRMSSFPPRIALNDSFSLVNALLNERRISEAGTVWNQAVVFSGLSDLQGPANSVLWDGGFESNVSGGGFSWIFSAPVAGVQVGFDAGEKHSGNRSLRLFFQGRSNINYTDVCHYVPVKPLTSYLFSAWVKTRALTTDQGIRFQLRPLDTRFSSTANTSDVHGAAPWTLVQMSWGSASDAHEVQVCIARFPSQEENNKIQGTAWVDDVALVPVSGEHPQP